MTDIPAGRCDLCGGEIAETRMVGSWNGRDGGGFLFAGRCLACDVDFQLALPNRRSAEWQRDAPGRSDLRAEVGTDELVGLSVKFDRYTTLGPKWQAFLARRRAGDEVWRFRSEDGLQNGYAVVRCGQPVSRFAVFGPV